jgi:hypothetical protein
MSVFQVARETELVTNVFVYYVNEAVKKIPVFNGLQKKYNFDLVDIAENTKLQHFLDFFNDMHQVDSVAIEEIGKKFIEEHEFPDTVFNFATALQHIESFYSIYQFDSANNAPTGEVVFGTVSRSVHRLVVRSPFPCEFEMGIIKGIAKRYDKKIKLEHHDFQCRMSLKSDRCDYFIIVL